MLKKHLIAIIIIVLVIGFAAAGYLLYGSLFVSRSSPVSFEESPIVSSAPAVLPEPATSTTENIPPVGVGSKPTVLASSTFSYSYPVSWGYYNPEPVISIIGVSLEKIIAKGNLYKQPEGELYQEGEMVNALIFRLKVKYGKEAVCLPSMLRRLVNEEGDLDIPINFKNPDANLLGQCGPSNTTYNDVKVIFAVPEGEKSFIFTTGTGSDIFFSVNILDNGEIKVENLTNAEG